jgi:opacity protein-like surface antigen
LFTHKTLAPAAAAMLLIATITPASAQQAAEQTSLVGFVGGVTDGGGTTFGGGMQFPVASRWRLAAEFGYLTGGQNFSGFGVDVDSHALTADVNAHFLFPLANGRFTPYVLGGVGYLRASTSVSAGGFAADASASTTGLNIGGGTTWNAGRRWAVRPELKVLVADGSNIRFSAAVAYGFGG